MSLNYTTLQAAILAQSVRAELTVECAQFVRMCESLIRREVKAYETRTSLADADRGGDTTTGLYTLPATIQVVRAIYGTAPAGNTFPLENVGVQGIRQLPASASPQHYAVSGSTLEVRGIPGAATTLEIVGLGWPVALEATPTNALLDSHEDIYMYGSLFYLYNFTQDLELAQSALSVFENAVAQLNKFNARKSGGSSVAPAYNFGHMRTGARY